MKSGHVWELGAADAEVPGRTWEEDRGARVINRSIHPKCSTQNECAENRTACPASQEVAPPLSHHSASVRRPRRQSIPRPNSKGTGKEAYRKPCT